MKRRVSILLILILVFGFAGFARGANGSLYLSPSSGNYTVGNTFSVGVMINTGGVSINAAQGTLVFSPDKLSVIGISKAGSIFSLWTTEPTYSNSLGTISFGGGVPNPGYTGSSGKIITITFRARVSGTASVNWSSGAVLANDGKGTNILTSMGGGTYTLGATIISPAPKPIVSSKTPAKPDISSSTHPDENKWYSNSKAEFSWSVSKDITGVSILLNQKEISNPGPLSDGLFNSKTYENLDDGVYYLHLKLKNSRGWGLIRHFRIQADTIPPQSFAVEIKQGKETDDPQPILIFEAKDDTSGIDHYKIRVDRDNSLATLFENGVVGIIDEVPSGPYKLSPRAPGKHTIVVEAFDKAGNSTAAVTELTVLAIEGPQITKYPKHLSLEEDLVIQGTSLPGLDIECYIKKKGEEVIIGKTKADQDGNWSYIHDQFLAKGVYRIYAIAINEKGAQGYPSDEKTVIVSLPPLFKIGNIVIDYISVIIVLLALIGVMVFGVYWGWYRMKRFRKRLLKETEDIERVLCRSFDLLKKDVDEQLKKLRKTKSRRQLKEEEKKVEEELKKDIDTVEKYIRREVKDVERRLK